jgi:nucleotide-binding universal stress UspA family protein
MSQDISADADKGQGRKTILVALDFSECSKAAFRKACDMFHARIERIIALHVIDSEFVQRCVTHRLGEEQKIKKELFVEAKRRLRKFVEREKLNGVETEAVVSEGIPYLEINKKAHAFNVDLVIIGSCGRAADTERIFFGTTAEKVLRFITHPVLCIPPETDCK